MRPEHHAMIGTVVAAGLLPFAGPLPSAGFLGGSLLIDLDHYLDFLVHNRFRNFSLPKAFLYHKHLFLKIKRVEFLSLEIFHTFEFLVCAGAWAFFSHSAMFQGFTAGMFVHCLSDILYLKRIGASSARAHSFLEYFLRKRRIVKRGFSPSRPYQEVLEEIGIAPSGRITFRGISS